LTGEVSLAIADQALPCRFHVARRRFLATLHAQLDAAVTAFGRAWHRIIPQPVLRAQFLVDAVEDIREFGDRSIPARMVLEEKKKPGHQTILQIRDVTFNEKIPPGTFTQQNLRRN